MAVSDISKDIIHVRSLLRSMGFAQLEATTVHEDNTEWGNNIIGGRERAKHIDIRKHFAHETIKNGHMILKKVACLEGQLSLLSQSWLRRGWTTNYTSPSP